MMRQLRRPQPEPFTQPRLLLVEGNDDSRFFGALVNYLGISGMDIRIYEGKTNLKPYLAVVPLTPGFHDIQSLGIVRDADGAASGAFESVANSLEAANLPKPANPLEVVGANPQITVCIIPPSLQSGALEDLCLGSVSDHPSMRCVEGFFDCVTEIAGEFPDNAAKARLQAFLAVKREPGKRLGEAAEAAYWPWHHPVFDEVKAFLRTL